MEKKNLILVVDDEEDIRLLLKDFLEKNGFEVMEAGDGQKAMQLAEEKTPDLVITDLLLPKEHGIDLMRSLKDRYLLPIIAISGIYKKNEINNCVNDIYIEEFFEKPLNLNEILGCVQSVLHE
jgi:DNA-binding response OmpR family regulator